MFLHDPGAHPKSQPGAGISFCAYKGLEKLFLDFRVDPRASVCANGALSAASLGRFAAGSGSTHAGYMSPAELRLLSEWLDIGAQYFNNPFDPKVPVN